MTQNVVLTYTIIIPIGQTRNKIIPMISYLAVGSKHSPHCQQCGDQNVARLYDHRRRGTAMLLRHERTRSCDPAIRCRWGHRRGGSERGGRRTLRCWLAALAAPTRDRRSVQPTASGHCVAAASFGGP